MKLDKPRAAMEHNLVDYSGPACKKMPINTANLSDPQNSWRPDSNDSTYLMKEEQKWWFSPSFPRQTEVEVSPKPGKDITGRGKRRSSQTSSKDYYK